MVTTRALDGSEVTAISTFRATFHVTHPTISAPEIVNEFKFPTRYQYSVGEHKKTKSGEAIEGTHTITHVCFSLHENPILFSENSITEFINAFINTFNKEYLNKIFETGGTCHFLLGIFSNDNVLFEFDVAAILNLAENKIGLKFDFYGGED